MPRINPEYLKRLQAGKFPTHHPSGEVSKDVIDLPVPEMFASGDKKVINWAGDNYYKACGAKVYLDEDGTQSHCLKREGHPSKVHEDFDGRTRNEYEFDFSGLELEEAVFQALGAASVCWTETTGIFQSDMCKAIGDALVKRIRDAGPIYG